MRKRDLFPLSYKLMLSYLLIVTVPILVIGFFAYITFISTIKEQTRINIQGSMNQIKENVNYKMKDAVRISDNFYSDNLLIRNLKATEAGISNYETTVNYLIPKLQSASHSANQSIWLSLYLKNKWIPEIFYNHNGQNDLLALKGAMYEIYHLDRIEKEDWYVSFPPEQYGSTMSWKQIGDDRNFGNISLLRRMIDIQNGITPEMIGFMRITMKMNSLFQSIDYHKLGEGSSVYVLGETGEIMYYSGDTMPFMPSGWDGQFANTHLLIREELPELNWSLVAMIPLQYLEESAKKVRNLTIIVCILSIVVFAFVGFVLSKYFSKRVTKIVSVLESFREGEFHKRIYSKSNDEFSRIYEALNEMGQNIGDLIQEVYLSNIQKKEAELESLQAQINPHFLYNTLSSISRLAQFGEIEKLHQMVMELAKFYRLTLNEGRTMIPIEKEIQQVQAYIEIQKIKYADRMVVRYDIDPEVYAFETVKLILQPFIENVLEHAWFDDRIHIRLTAAKAQDRIIIQIIDNGVGMKKETIRQIFEPHDGVYLGYGIRNVDQRIKLHYGNQYGVTIVSGLGIGSTVRIQLPAMPSKAV